MDFLTFLAKLSREQSSLQQSTTAPTPKPTITPISADYFIKDRFRGKSVLVTGGARGIGRATAVRAAREGANVVIADWLQAEGQQTVNFIKDNGGVAEFVYVDVSNTADCDRMVKHTVNKFGGLDLAVNNAGVMDGVYSGDMFNYDKQRNLLPSIIHLASDDYWSNVLKVNIDGTFKSMRAELRQLVKQGRGGSAIVNVGSVAGLTGMPGNPAYAASKHAINGLTRNAAIDYAPYAIRINSVNMASTATPMTDKNRQLMDALRKNEGAESVNFAKTQSVLTRANPSHPDSTVWEQVAVILFLLSDEASNLTGGNFSTDGGWTAF